MSFIRTLSSAVATSIVNTVWENGANYIRASSQVSSTARNPPSTV